MTGAVAQVLPRRVALIDRGPYAGIARLLVILTVLNLNGVANMTLGLERAMSLVMFGTALVLIAKYARYAWSIPFVLFLTAIASYIIFGVLFYSRFTSAALMNSLLIANAGTVMVVWAMAAYVASIASEQAALDQFLRFVRNIAIVAAGSVLASPLLYQLYVNLPQSAETRWGGFFGNPNEAAMVAVVALALSLALPFRDRIVQILALALSLVAIILTFSKTATLVACVIVAIEFMRRAKGATLILIPLAAALMITFLQDPRVYFDALAAQQLIPLEQEQQNRIRDIGVLLSGQFDDETTTGRTLVWQLGLERAIRAFPAGYGLGSFHMLEGGLFQGGTWLGVHNTFLMFWGESGVLPMLLLALAFVGLAIAVVRRVSWQVGLSTMIVLLADLSATHSALVTRYDNVILGILLGLVVLVDQRKVVTDHTALRVPPMPWTKGGRVIAARRHD